MRRGFAIAFHLLDMVGDPVDLPGRIFDGLGRPICGLRRFICCDLSLVGGLLGMLGGCLGLGSSGFRLLCLLLVVRSTSRKRNRKNKHG